MMREREQEDYNLKWGRLQSNPSPFIILLTINKDKHYLIL